MQQSEKVDQLYKALLNLQGELEHAPKTSKNPHFKSNYADLPTVLDTAKPVLQKHGLGIHHYRKYELAGERVLEFLVTRLFHAASSQWIDSPAFLNPVKNDPQGIGSAITYTRRYDDQAILGMASEDDDGNAASGRSASQPSSPVTSTYTRLTTAPTSPATDMVSEFKSLIAEACSFTGLPTFERDFVAQQNERIGKYGSDLKVSQKQYDLAKRIVDDRGTKRPAPAPVTKEAAQAIMDDAPPSWHNDPNDPGVGYGY